MLISSTVNIPLAVFTIVLRRLIDRYRSSEPRLQVACKSVNLLYNYPVLRPIFYIYIFIAGLYYAMKYWKKGVLIVKKSTRLRIRVPVKERASKLKTKSSFTIKKCWLLKNLIKDKPSKEKALKYIASIASDESEINQPDKRYYDYNLSTYTFNPNYEPNLKRPSLENQSIPKSKSDVTIKTILSPREIIYSSGPSIISTSSLNSNILSIQRSDIPLRGTSRRCGRSRKRIVCQVSDLETISNASGVSEIIYKTTRSGKMYAKPVHMRKKRS